MRHRNIIVAVAGAALLLAGLPAMADKPYVYGQWLPPKHNVNKHGPWMNGWKKRGLNGSTLPAGNYLKPREHLRVWGIGQLRQVSLYRVIIVHN